MVPLRSPRNAALTAAATMAVGGLVWYLFRRPRPTAEEIERTRRDLLAANGRITDGSIIEAPFTQQDDSSSSRQVIVYNYRIAGVSYEAAQDVASLGELVRDIRTDLPIQVRYEPHNPANSIVVAEAWSGLRLSSTHPHPDAQANSD
ncbi:DUF3592 domain-containing protein [Edaphobacter albus]|uniref:DUF3592 domain-containing protein n=1 Tax=Edaphobacter sp. 4G125 TaxID=2763071 RepID=UPI001644680A|nr:hypothetical protein [Edaphobacter sp. 4G125]QNI36964.1 hypothetical protein H7846_01070 [Edaphobacter sp. 4G125]